VGALEWPCRWWLDTSADWRRRRVAAVCTRAHHPNEMGPAGGARRIRSAASR
jgi:hypothetical protein